jgi:hypothetical protein
LAISFFTCSSCASQLNTGGPPDGRGPAAKRASQGGTHSPGGQLATTRGTDVTS